MVNGTTRGLSESDGPLSPCASYQLSTPLWESNAALVRRGKAPVLTDGCGRIWPVAVSCPFGVDFDSTRLRVKADVLG